MSVMILILSVLAAAGLTTGLIAVAWLLLSTRKNGNKIQRSQEEAAASVSNAQEEQRRILLAAQEEALRIREAGDQEIKNQRRELNRMERRHTQKEEQLDQRSSGLDHQESEIERRESIAQSALQQAEDVKEQHTRELERIASLTISEARDIVLKRSEDEASHELAKRYYELEKEHQLRADDKRSPHHHISYQPSGYRRRFGKHDICCSPA